MKKIKGSELIKINFRGNILNRIEKEQWILILNVVIIFVMGVLHAIEAGHYADFIPINGTFQDYNPIRRFLNGQVPYRDFQDYLGMGHLYLGTLFTGILGGKYKASLIAFRFVAYLSTALIFYVVTKIIFKSEKTALIVSNIFLVLLIIQPTFLEALVGDVEIKDALDYAMTTGNSARMLRGGIVPIVVLFLLKFGKKIKEKAESCKKLKCETFFCIIGGIFAGFSFQWSNDYGVSSWLCLVLMIFYFVLSRERQFFLALKGGIIAIITSVVSCFFFVNLFTLGHFVNWFKATFGTGGYQAWYYIGDKSYYITDVDFSYIMLIQAFLTVFYLCKVWKCHAEYEALIRYGLLAYMNMTSFCAVNEYKLLSGGSSREVALVILFITAMSEIINYLSKTLLSEKVVLIISKVSIVICVAWIIGALQTEVNFYFFKEKEGVYVEKMGGYMTKLGEDILATDEFLGNAKTFATYASGQELVSGNYQPSGTDYLIHVLGDTQRGKYLEAFKNGDFDYAATINEAYSGWEFWLQRANWFFYQSLFANWHPIYANSYEVYWERNCNNDNSIYGGDIDVSIENTDSRALKVVVKTDKKISGIADVYLDYEAKKDDGLTKHFIFSSMVNEQNTGRCFCEKYRYESTNIRSAGKEYIPVTVVDGYGEVTLTAQPANSMFLTIDEVRCEQIYEVQFKYLYIDDYKEEEEQYLLHVAESSRQNKIAEDISRIYIDDLNVPIEDFENGYIIINKNEINLDKNFLKSGNMFKVER